jgi:gas vesicle protein
LVCNNRLMHKTITLATAALTAAMIFACSACSENTASFSKEQRDQLDQVVSDFMEERHLPGVVVGAWVPGEGR